MGCQEWDATRYKRRKKTRGRNYGQLKNGGLRSELEMASSVLFSCLAGMAVITESER